MPEVYGKRMIGSSILIANNILNLGVAGCLASSSKEADLMVLGLNHGEDLVNAVDELLNDYLGDILSSEQRAEFETLLAKCKKLVPSE